MTTLLLDTHTVLWYWWNSPQLSATAKTEIQDANNRKVVSLATPWEVAIKVSRKKLDIGGPFAGFFEEQMPKANFEWLQSTLSHVTRLIDLPFHHADPFDRLMICQSLEEQFPIVSGDPQFDAYGVKRIW